MSPDEPTAEAATAAPPTIDTVFTMPVEAGTVILAVVAITGRSVIEDDRPAIELSAAIQAVNGREVPCDADRLLRILADEVELDHLVRHRGVVDDDEVAA